MKPPTAPLERDSCFTATDKPAELRQLSQEPVPRRIGFAMLKNSYKMRKLATDNTIAGMQPDQFWDDFSIEQIPDVFLVLFAE